jgi:hypothetical protein
MKVWKVISEQTNTTKLNFLKKKEYIEFIYLFNFGGNDLISCHVADLYDRLFKKLSSRFGCHLIIGDANSN